MTPGLIERLEAAGEHTAKTKNGFGVDALIEHHLREAVADGILEGIQMAIETLETAKPLTADENQTWDTATALLAIVKAGLNGRRATSKPKEGETPSSEANRGGA